MLGHKVDPEGKQSIRFHLRDDGLYKVDVLVKPGDKEHAKAYFNKMKSRLDGLYGDLAKGGRRWSDGTVSVAIELKGSEVHVAYSKVGR